MRIHYDHLPDSDDELPEGDLPLISRINFDQLSMFVDAVDLGSFSAAARKHRKTPAAISNMIGNLEIDLDLTLFDRSGYRAALKPVGRKIYAQARKTLKMIDHLERLAGSIREGLPAQVDIIADSWAPCGDFFRAMPHLARAYPQVDFRIRILPEQKCKTHLDQSEHSIFFGRQRLAPQNPAHSFPLTPVECRPAAAPNHPLARRGGPCPEAEALAEHTFIRVATRQTLSFLPDHPETVTVEDPLMGLHLIGEGLGWGILPGHLAIGLEWNGPALPQNAFPPEPALAACNSANLTPVLEAVRRILTGKT